MIDMTDGRSLVVRPDTSAERELAPTNDLARQIETARHKRAQAKTEREKDREAIAVGALWVVLIFLAGFFCGVMTVDTLRNRALAQADDAAAARFAAERGQ